MTMTSSRPHLVRALYEWILENDCTPYVLVNAEAADVDVPREHVKDGQIVLNIAPVAVQNLLISNDCLTFDGRFAGVPRPVYVPVAAVMGIYARENGQGMIFEAEGLQPDPNGPGGGDNGGNRPQGSDKADSGKAGKPDAGDKPRKPALRVVK